MDSPSVEETYKYKTKRQKKKKKKRYITTTNGGMCTLLGNCGIFHMGSLCVDPYVSDLRNIFVDNAFHGSIGFRIQKILRGKNKYAHKVY